jgi:hypothetical protein
MLCTESHKANIQTGQLLYTRRFRAMRSPQFTARPLQNAGYPAQLHGTEACILCNLIHQDQHEDPACQQKITRLSQQAKQKYYFEKHK